VPGLPTYRVVAAAALAGAPSRPTVTTTPSAARNMPATLRPAPQGVSATRVPCRCRECQPVKRIDEARNGGHTVPVADRRP
jgi:hypothetical protein